MLEQIVKLSRLIIFYFISNFFSLLANSSKQRAKNHCFSQCFRFRAVFQLLYGCFGCKRKCATNANHCGFCSKLVQSGSKYCAIEMAGSRLIKLAYKLLHQSQYIVWGMHCGSKVSQSVHMNVFQHGSSFPFTRKTPGDVQPVWMRGTLVIVNRGKLYYIACPFQLARSVSGKNMARSVYFFRSPTKTSQSPWIFRFNLVHAVRFLNLLD